MKPDQKKRVEVMREGAKEFGHYCDWSRDILYLVGIIDELQERVGELGSIPSSILLDHMTCPMSLFGGKSALEYLGENGPDSIHDIIGNFRRCGWECEVDHFVEKEKQKNQTLRALLDKALEGLEFYRDWWMPKEETVDLQKTTAVFHVENPKELPKNYKYIRWEPRGRLRADHGEKARKLAAEIRACYSNLEHQEGGMG